MHKLEKDGWVNLYYQEYIPDSGRGYYADSQSAYIAGMRPITEKKIEEEKKEIQRVMKELADKKAKERREEIRTLKRLAKKHGYTLLQEGDIARENKAIKKSKVFA
jgi:predicted transcriptional regulator